MSNPGNKKNVVIMAVISVVAVAVIIVGVVFLNKYRSGGYGQTEMPQASATDDTTVSSPSANLPDVSVSQNADTSATHAITVSGDTIPELDAEYFTKIAYELRYLYAQYSFAAPSELSVNVLVQFAFCHVFHDTFVDTPSAATPVYRDANGTQISEQLKKFFNLSDTEITESDLYNTTSGKFEMWDPCKIVPVYADTTCAKVNDTSCTLTLNYFNDAAKTTAKPDGKLLLTLNKGDSGYYIASMQAAE